jgi:hypothetical protein
MKKAVLLAASLGCMIQAQAQIGKTVPENKKLKEHRAMVQKALKGQLGGGTAQKPTGTQHRVIAQTMLEAGDLIPDSTTFKYSGTKGSNFNYDNQEFVYTADFSSWYAPRPLFPMVENPLDMLADTISDYYDNILTTRATAAYRPDNKLLSSTSTFYATPPTPNFYNKTVNGYNTQGHVIASYELRSNDNGVSYQDTNTVTRTSYNAAFTQVVADSIYEQTGSGLEFNTLVRYFYSVSGKLDSMITTDASLSPLEKLSFDYYSDGKLRKLTAISMDGFNATDSFGYTSGIGYTTLWDSKASFEFEGETMIYGSRILKYPGTGGLPDSLRMFDYESTTGDWTYYMTAKYSYTTFSEPQQIDFAAGSDPLGTIKFYYESYDDGVSAINPVAVNKDFSIYPNPFRSNIAIDWKGKAQSNVSVRLVNILGQEVYSTAMELNTGSNTLNLPALNSGNYILVIRDAAGKSWSSKVVKQ